MTIAFKKKTGKNDVINWCIKANLLLQIAILLTYPAGRKESGEMKVFIGFLLFAFATADIYKWVGLPEQNFKLLDNLLNGEHSAIYLRVKFCWCETSNLRSLFTKAFIGIVLACSYFLQTATCCNAKTVY